MKRGLGLSLGLAQAVLLAALAGQGVAAPIAAPPPSLAECNDARPWRLLKAQVQAPMPAAFAHAQAVALNAQFIRWPQAREAERSRFRLVASAEFALQLITGQAVVGVSQAWPLEPVAQASAAADPVVRAAQARVPHVSGGVLLQLTPQALAALPQALAQQLMLVQEDANGHVLAATALQHAGALDALFAAKAQPAVLGALADKAATRFALWAPTAHRVSLCLFEGDEAQAADGPATQLLPMQAEPRSGVWRAAQQRQGVGSRAARLRAEGKGDGISDTHYLYLVDVYVPAMGLVRQRVTDPYSLSLTADSARSAVVNWQDPRLAPAGWAQAARPKPGLRNTDLAIYELHVRDFSIGDASVPVADRGKYTAFTHTASHGMRHLRALAQAGMTDVHLLPVFDIASIPERACVSVPDSQLQPWVAAGQGASEVPQARLAQQAAGDCFNWGYDPWHYTSPEGSYATQPGSPSMRIREFRQMVMALHAAGLRVGMDVVYNHTPASGQNEKSVLDRIVPGYYHRLDAQGQVERSTCCDNTATEHAMMAKLMIDSAATWAQHYRIDSFRFDLMGHQPRQAMLRLQAAVNRAAGRPIHLIGEGWNFGEVANGKRFVQAAQGRLAGTAIASFSDRGRDAMRGGGCCDGPDDAVSRQGWLNGLHHARNEAAIARGLGTAQELAEAADLVRLSLAGTLKPYSFTTADGSRRNGEQLQYAGQAAGFAQAPGEVVNYVENHDNPTLFDLNLAKLPRNTSAQDRARVQVLGLATVALSQGVAYFHAGGELMRSKSFDRNSFDSGDWFNRLDFSASGNGFPAGLPFEQDNGAHWPWMRPLLQDASLAPSAQHIRFVRDAFNDWLRIRGSTRLLRMSSARDVQARLNFPRQASAVDGTAIVAHLNGKGLAGASFAELVYAINVGTQAASLKLPAHRGKRFVLHPVLRSPQAADAARAREASWDRASGTLRVPARTALVYVLN